MQDRVTGQAVVRAALLVALLTGAAQAETTLTLQDPSELADAIASLDGAGGTILLPGGDYAPLFLRESGAEGSPLVLAAADPGNPPRFPALETQRAEHVVLEGLILDYRFAPGDQISTRPFILSESRDITLRRVLIDGDDARGTGSVDDGFGFGIGLNVLYSRDITIEESEIRGFHRGIGVGEVQGFTLTGSLIHDLRSDGMNFSQVSDVRIENNVIRDFRRPPKSDDHADMIQFWTVGTDEPSTDIVIRNNVLNSGRELYTQSIFMRNERVDQGDAGRELYYRNVTIEGNVVINAHLHGITVGETIGLTIANNTLIENRGSINPADADPNSDVWTPQIVVSKRAQDVRILRNAVATITGPDGQADWQVEDNLRIQVRTRGANDFYTRMFADPLRGDPRDLATFASLPGGPLDGTGIGAPRLDPP